MEEIEELRILSEQKETDWKIVVQKRIDVLEKENAAKNNMLEDVEEKMTTLMEDFTRNLKLLEARDDTLKAYEKMLEDLKGELNAKIVELNEANVRLDETQTSLKHQETCQRDLHKNYEQRMLAKDEQFHFLQSARDVQFKIERCELERIKCELEQQLNVANTELELQKKELLQGFDDEMVKREHEYKLKADELETKCHEQHVRNQMLAKEIEMVTASREKDAVFLREMEASRKEVVQRLEDCELQLAESKSTADFRMRELEAELARVLNEREQLLQSLEKKQSEFDCLANEKNSEIDHLKSSAIEREERNVRDIAEITEKYDAGEVKIRQLNCQIEDLTTAKEHLIEKFQNEMDNLQTDWGKQMNELSQNNTTRDLELGELRDKVTKLNDQVIAGKEDINRYKRQLSQAAERERNLERQKEQCELEWRKKCEDAGRIEYGKNQEFVRTISASRDEAQAEVREKDRLLKEKENIIKALESNKNADSLLDRPKVKTADVDNSQSVVEELRRENDTLRNAISEMRSQMELVSSQSPQKSDKPGPLEEHDSNRGMSPRAEGDGVFNVTNNPAVLSHLKSLNNIIASLRSEKLELLTQIKKQQVRLEFLTGQVESLSKLPREKQVEVDQVRYELSALSRRSTAECESLRQRVSDLELEVKEVSKEAEQYHRATLEKEERITQLENEISSQKLDMARKIQPVNFGAQELLIKQLQDELHNLHGRHDDAAMPCEQSIVQELREKLRVAARHVLQLTRDKQQLIELGNRLRAQLNQKVKYQTPTTPPQTPRVSEQITRKSRNPYRDAPSNQLSALETLQYQLTKRELQLAKMSPERGPKNDVQTTRSSGPARNGPEHTPQLLVSAESSYDVDGLQDVWQILEQSGSSTLASLSPTSVPPSQDPRVKEVIGSRSNAEHSTNQAISVTGNKAQIKSQRRPLSRGPQISRVNVANKTKRKIRNYNERNDR